MRQGAIAFYTNSHEIRHQLKMMNMSLEQLTTLSDEEFAKCNNVVKEAVLLLLLTHSQCWGYVVKKINRRNGQTAWKIVNHEDKFKEVADDVIYLTLNLEDYDFKLWDEMENRYSIARSKGGSPIRKSPSKSNKANCSKKEFKIGKSVFYQIVECNEDPYYSSSHPFNNQWEKHNPYFQDPSSSYYKSFMNPYVKQSIHAIPFLRTNITPTKVSVWIKPKEPVDTPRMFFKFPQGIPIRII